ncbi:MAG: DUF1800 domain-containing protein [Sulfurovum sp.]|nr:DUF1800 domain-containing protein [Sulfurovum sp.]
MLKYLLLSIIPLSVFATDISECIHLLNRTSFGVDKKQLSVCLQSKNYKQAVKKILSHSTGIEDETAPLYAQKPSRPHKKFSKLNASERNAFQKIRRKEWAKLRALWFKKMLKTEDPFLEHMVLFWHNHFTSGLKKTKHPMVMYQQNMLFRKHAFGNYAKLLHAIVEDPAMLIYLDNRVNKKGHPNENLGREFLELFTMGEGNYSEKDIQELSRALTGYSLNRNLKFRFKKKLHDSGKKQIFGHEGNFDAHDMIDIILEQNATSRHIVKKLWYHYVSYDIDESELGRLSRLLKEQNYEIRPLLFAILTSKHFRDPAVRGTMIKSPIELTVGTLRTFGYKDFDPVLGVQYAKRLGQLLLDPPNVKGWKGGKNWIDANTLLLRKGFLSKLTRGDEMQKLRYDLFDLTQAGKTEEERVAKILLPINVYLTPSNNFKQTIRTILQHPLYQLK